MHIPLHQYVSTACQHGRHKRCRVVCTFCSQMCLCHCHWQAKATPKAEEKYEEEMAGRHGGGRRAELDQE